MQDYSAAGTLKILAMLRKALRLERSRGRSGHWTYDLNRHRALAESLKAEREHLRKLDGPPAAPQRTARSGPAPRAGKVLHLSPQATANRSAISRALDHPCSLSSPDQPAFLLPILAESSS
jgi:hypothetical protein